MMMHHCTTNYDDDSWHQPAPTMIPFPSYYHLSTLQPRAPIASLSLLVSIQTLMALRLTSIGLDFPLAMMDDKNEWFVTRYLLTTHCNGQHCHLPFVPRIYTPYRRVGVAIATAEGSSAVQRQFFMHNSYIFTPVWGRFGTIPQLYWHVSAPAMHHTTINWFRSAVYMLGWQGGVVYSRHNARFSYLVHQKNGVNFHLVWYWW